MISGLQNENMIDTKETAMKRKAYLILMIVMISSIANAQKIRTYTASDEDSITCITSASLYIEFFKQGNFKDALPGWRKAIAICPRFSESLWTNGTKMYQDLIEVEEDDAKKNLLMDTLEWIYDQRIEYYPDGKGSILGRKGTDMAKYRSSNPKKAHDVLSESYNILQLEMEPAALIYYFKTAYDMKRKNLVEDTYVLNLYGPCSDVVQNNKDGTYGSAYLTAQKNIDNMVGKVAGDCETLIGIFKPKFGANPKDAVLLAQITKLLDKLDCSDEDFYLKVAVAQYELDPAAEAAFAIGKAYYRRKDYGQSNKYFKEVADGTEDKDMLFESYQFLGAGMLSLGQAQSAKSYALKMLEINAQSGDAYLIIGNAYVKGRKDCGGDECKSRAVYWAAVDKFSKAKAVDPGVAEKAQQYINSYVGQFPKKEDCFFYGLTDGQSYTLDCWIGETTTVRTRE
jgi:tetratricopeptide (TPR) repeat protein